MRIGFGHLGHTHILWHRFMGYCGIELAPPPPSSQAALDIGIQYCPEGLCTPCKILFGNYVQSLDQGSDCLVMLGGERTCRLGYSVREQTLLLRRLGYEFQMHVLDLQNFAPSVLSLVRQLVDRPPQFLLEAVRFLIDLINLIDDVERVTLRIRPREGRRGQTDQALRRALAEIGTLADRKELRQRRAEILEVVQEIPHEAEKPCPRVALVGDPYTIMESFFNLNMVETLGQLGLEINRWFWFDEGIQFNPIPRLLGRSIDQVYDRLAEAYLAVDVGGFVRSSVGAAAHFVRQGYDGLIHVAPFGCTPESVGEVVLKAARQDGLPLLSLEFDEQTGRAGLLTRLEAYTDMLLRHWRTPRG